MNLMLTTRYKLGRHVRQNPQRLLKHLVLNAGLVVKSVIHCGAHLAQERYYYESIGAEKIVWIEGSPVIFEGLTQSLNNDLVGRKLKAKHVPINALLYSEDGIKIKLHGFSNNGESNSIFRAADAFKARWPLISETGIDDQLVSTTLDTIFQSDESGGVDLLVLDLQGAEIEVLRGGLQTLTAAKAVICEVSKLQVYEGGALYTDVVSFMKSAGFIDMHRSHTCGDLLFVKKGLI
jgi:FkbM family methyltransferase